MNLKCRLKFHSPINMGFAFQDTVSGEAVYDWKCSKCHKTWMATSKYSLFKVHTNKKEHAGLGEWSKPTVCKTGPEMEALVRIQHPAQICLN